MSLPKFPTLSKDNLAELKYVSRESYNSWYKLQELYYQVKACDSLEKCDEKIVDNLCFFSDFIGDDLTEATLDTTEDYDEDAINKIIAFTNDLCDALDK